jgi:hypothetical protein
MARISWCIACLNARAASTANWLNYCTPALTYSRSDGITTYTCPIFGTWPLVTLRCCSRYGSTNAVPQLHPPMSMAAPPKGSVILKTNCKRADTTKPWKGVTFLGMRPTPSWTPPSPFWIRGRQMVDIWLPKA